MRKIICPVCGKESVDKSWRQDKQYCSDACARKARYCKNSEESCPYNDGVMCMSKRCSKCGWNPLVAKIRQLQMELDIMKGVFNETHICTKR